MDGFIIERIDDENVIRLSDEQMRERGLSVGDEVEFKDSPKSRKFERTMALAEEEMEAHSEALAVLAK